MIYLPSAGPRIHVTLMYLLCLLPINATHFGRINCSDGGQAC